MLTTLVISCCLVFIFLQLTNPYISLAKNAIKHTTTETYLISYRLANIHNIIKTISLAAYANAKYGLLLKVRYLLPGGSAYSLSTFFILTSSIASLPVRCSIVISMIAMFLIEESISLGIPSL